MLEKSQWRPAASSQNKSRCSLFTDRDPEVKRCTPGPKPGSGFALAPWPLLTSPLLAVWHLNPANGIISPRGRFSHAERSLLPQRAERLSPMTLQNPPPSDSGEDRHRTDNSVWSFSKVQTVKTIMSPPTTPQCTFKCELLLFTSKQKR